MTFNKNINVSVIIRTKNEEQWIGHVIQSVIDLIYKPEIIIIDNKSSDETLNIVRHFIHDPKLESSENNNYTDIKIISVADYTPGKSLNLGVKNCKFNNLMIISAHCVLKHINLDKHIKDLRKFSAIFGKQNPIWRGKKISKRYLWNHFQDKEVVNMFSKQENRYFLHNAAVFYNKDFLIENPFDEFLAGKEDRYWANSIIKNGFSFLYDPVFEVDHHYTLDGNTWKGLA